jgi:hypothetical protein
LVDEEQLTKTTQHNQSAATGSNHNFGWFTRCGETTKVMVSAPMFWADEQIGIHRSLGCDGIGWGFPFNDTAAAGNSSPLNSAENIS